MAANKGVQNVTDPDNVVVSNLDNSTSQPLNEWLDAVGKTNDKVNTLTLPEPYDIDEQQVIGYWDFATTETENTSDILATYANPYVELSSITESGGIEPNVVGVVSGVFGLTELPGSWPRPTRRYSVGMNSLGETLDENAFSLNFSITVPSGNVLCIHGISYGLAYESDFEDDRYYRPRTQLYYSFDNTTWVAEGGVFSLGGKSAAAARYGGAESGGIYYNDAGRYNQLTDTTFGEQFNVNSGETVYIKIAISQDDIDIPSTSNRRRASISNIKIDGTLSKDVSSSATNGFVYEQSSEFNAWPANYGHWSYNNGNEIVMSWVNATWVDNPSGHDLDYDTRKFFFARSTDGGSTWSQPYELSNVNPEDSSIPTTSRSGIDMTNENLAIMYRGSRVWWSTDKARSFEGPAFITGRAGWNLDVRTSYHIIDEDNALLFFTGRRNISYSEPGIESRNQSYVWATDTSGFNYGPLREDEAPIGSKKMFAQVASNYDAYSIMPRVVHMGGDRFVVAIRESIRTDKWIGIYETLDSFKTQPRLIARLAQDDHNPPALVRTSKNGLAMVYGSRENGPQGMCITISNDGGYNWSIPGYLRQDASDWDFGYPIAFMRPDGKLWCAYYYVTSTNPNQHIAYTIVDLDNLDLPPLPSKGIADADTIISV